MSIVSSDLPDVTGFPARCYELVAVRSGVTFGEHWPTAPGAVRFALSGRPLVLHLAPERWLLADPDEDVLSECKEYVTAGLAALSNVDGKWQMLALSIDVARGVLARSCFVESILNSRGCAATVLFDCPVVISARREAIDIWVQSSHLSAFLKTCCSLRGMQCGPWRS